VPTGDPVLDHRTGAALVCVQTIGDVCGRVLVLGGRNADGSLADEDLLLDGTCVVQHGGCAPVLQRHAHWLQQRRAGARAALAEGGRVVVTGGRGADGSPLLTVETIDVSDPNAPVPGRVVGTLSCADPSAIAVSNGSVMVAGGRCADGSASREIWFYRY
jgi:hypothetical protein